MKGLSETAESEDDDKTNDSDESFKPVKSDPKQSGNDERKTDAGSFGKQKKSLKHNQGG